MNTHDFERPIGQLSRRRWLQTIGVAGVSLLAEGCLPQSEARAPAPNAAARPTATQLQPLTKPVARVAIAQATSYGQKIVRQQVRALIDGIGGLDELIKRGPRVAIKINLTGGTSSKPVPGVSLIESFVTHPMVVRALCEALREAGANKLFIVEAVYERASFSQWGYADIA